MADHLLDWTPRRTIDADTNLYDRYHDDEHGSAVVYGGDRHLFGWANGVPFDVTYPDLTDVTGDRGNVQAVRIRPEAHSWWVYAYCDGPAGKRTEMMIAVSEY